MSTTPISLSTPVDIEGDLLGAAMHSSAAVDGAREDGLRPESFSQRRNSEIFAAMLAQREEGGETDELTIARRLEQAGTLDSVVGGEQYVSMLAARPSPSAITNPGRRVAQVLEASRLRRLHDCGHRLLALRGVNGDCSAIHEEMRELLSETANAAVSSTLVDFTEIEARPVKFAWRDRIALGKITALAGRPKIGKGLLYSHLIAGVTNGTLDGDLSGPRRAIIVTTEDEPGDTLKPRLMAAGADISRASYFTMGSPESPVPFRVPQDAEELGRRVAETEAALVVIDPLIEFIDGKADSHKSQPVRQAVAALNAIAREQGCAVLTIFHLNKGISTDPLLRHEGSAAFTQIVRAGLMLGFDPDDPEGEEGDQRVLAVSASNLARLATSLVYKIDGSTVEGDTGEPITTAAMRHIGESGAASHDLLRGREDDAARADRDEATDFLRSELADGSRPAGEIKRAAEQAGVGPGALKRAKRELHVESSKVGMSGGWAWTLPEGDDTKADALLRENPSPSSPSFPRAKSNRPLRGDSVEGDGSGDAGSLPENPSPSSPCRYSDHRESDYSGEGGKVICGTCHPRAEGAS